MRFQKSSSQNDNESSNNVISQETADHLKWIENNIKTTTLIDSYVLYKTFL